MGIESTRLLGVLVFAQASLLAQVILSVHPGQWVQNRYAHHDFDSNFVCILDEKNRVVEQVKLPVREPGKVISVDGTPFQSPGPRFGNPFAWEGVWHVVRYARDSKDAKRVNVDLLAEQEGVWYQKVAATLSGGIASEVFPLGPKRYLLITRAALPARISVKWSPFQVFRPDTKDELEFEGVLDPDLPGATEQELRMESISFIPVITDTHLVVLSPHRGRLWSFDLAKGRLERTRDLFTLPTTRVRTAFGPLPAYPIILNVFPQVDGRIVLMTRSERAVEETIAETERIKFQGQMTFEAGAEQKAQANARFQKEQDSAFGNNPILQWWDFDPTTGELKRLNRPPKGGAEMLQDQKELEAFKVRPLRNGDLVALRFVGSVSKK